MKIFTLLSLLIIHFCLSAQDSIVTFYSQNGNTKASVHISHGRFNGNYTSWYENGTKMASGNFKDNQKYGVWTVWDVNGNRRMSRDYQSNYQYTNLETFDTEGNQIKSAERTIDSLRRDETGLLQYAFVKERDVLISKRIWRFIPFEEVNDLLFENNLLMAIIQKGIADTSILNAYSPESDQFEIKLTSKEAVHRLKKAKDRLIGFKIKEDWWYDTNRQLADVRIIGVCPVVSGDTNDEVSDLFWIYYPELRKLLALASIHIENSELIQNLEDVFYFRRFSSLIYRDLSKADYPDEDISNPNEKAINRSNKIEMELLELEMSAWVDQLQ